MRGWSLPGPTGNANVAPAPPLNLHLIVTVIGFGSRNVFALEPLLERATTAIPLEGIDADGY
ncbi:MAG: hypothetical protein RLZZ326_473 [Planctomycetota bacterium]